MSLRPKPGLEDNKPDHHGQNFYVSLFYAQTKMWHFTGPWDSLYNLDHYKTLRLTLTLSQSISGQRRCWSAVEWRPRKFMINDDEWGAGWRASTARRFMMNDEWGAGWRASTARRFMMNDEWGAGWRASKSKNRGSTSTARRLERDKVMQVRGLCGSENLVSKRE